MTFNPLPDDGSSASGGSSESEDEDHEPYLECFSLNNVDLRDDSEQLLKHLDEFRLTSSSTCKSRYPSMILLLQHFEVFLSSIKIEKVAQIVSSYYRKQKRNRRTQEYIEDTKLLYCSLRLVIGAADFDRVSRHIRNGEATMAQGLAPSLTMRSMNCSSCRARKCLHLFCPECGVIFNAKKEALKELGIPSSVMPKKMINKRGPDSRMRKTVDIVEDLKSVAKEKRSINLQVRCDKAAINGIMELMKSVKDDMYLMAYGGDIVLLLRNIAVASTGEPSDLAKSCFREVCARWMKGHAEMKSKSREGDDSDDDEEVQDKIKDRIIKDTVEGLYVINKMLLSDSEDCKKLMRDARVDSNKRKELQNVVKGRTKRSSQPSFSDDDDDDDNDNCNGDDYDNGDDSDDDNSDVDQSRATTTARIANPKEISSHILSNKSSSSSTSNKGSVFEAMKEDKYMPLIKIMERNKTGMATGEEPIYYNSDGEAMGANPGPSVRNQWGNRVSTRHLRRNDGDASDGCEDLPNLSSKGGGHDDDRDTSRSVLKKRKGSAAVNNDLRAPRKHGVPSRSIKRANEQKEDSKIERTGAIDDANPLLPPCDFTTATLVMREILSRRMRQHNDALIDFIPTLGDNRKRVTRGSLLPVTIVTQCGGCGCTDKNKGRTSCTTCDRELKEHVDYSAVLDTMLWSYFFASAELEKSDLYAGYCRQIVQLLPLLRCYLTRQELGSTFFRWQCYFATHVIYYFSDYGQQALNRQLFSEEFRLIVNNLEHVTKHLKDAELVGEFVQCLKILQYTEEADPELEPMVREALLFLINRKRDGIDRNKKGAKDFSEYDARYKAYHTSYCASIGLLEYGFSKNEESRLNPPIPSIFNLCVTHKDTV